MVHREDNDVTLPDHRLPSFDARRPTTKATMPNVLMVPAF
jgi:hypothetical protein